MLIKCHKCRGVYEDKNKCPVCGTYNLQYMAPVMCENCGVKMTGHLDTERDEGWFVCPECGRYEQ